MVFDERLLEFPSVRTLLASHAVSGLGRSRINAVAPLSDLDQLLPLIQLVKEMIALVATRGEPPIHGLRDVTEHLSRARRQRAVLEPQDLLDLKDFIETAGHTRRFFEPFQTEFPALHALAMPMDGVPHLVRDIDSKIAPNAMVRDQASDLLAQIRSEISAAETSIQRDLNRMVRDFTTSGDLQDDFFTLRNDRYVLPVKTSNRSRVPGIIHDSSNTGETVFIEPFAILELTNKLADLKLREREEIYRILLHIANHVRDSMNPVLVDLDLLGEMDFVLAKARFGIRHQASFPSLTNSDRPLNLVNAHHPLLYADTPQASRPLNLGLDLVDHVLVISGPNAGGKTTALKTIGLIALMIQCGIPAPLDARSRMPVFASILANIGDEQNILEGQSTFSSHIKRIAQILDVAGYGSLVLLDELGTATDPGEGGALGVAILESLAERGSLTIVSSHLGALKSWAHSYPEARNASFRLDDRSHRPTYRLALDIVGISEALVVAEHVGLPAEILARARSLRPEGEGDATALLLSLQEKESRLADELDQAERLRMDLEERQQAFETQEDALRIDRRKYRAKIDLEKERELGELRGRVEQMIARLPAKADLLSAKSDIETLQKQTRQDIESGKRDKGSPLHRALKAGDNVHVTTLKENGVVQSVDLDRAIARVSVGRMVVSVGLDKLKRLAPTKSDSEAPTTGRVNFQRPQMESSILDLHGHRVDEAIKKTDKFIDQALAAGYSHIKVMHGQGSGALRKALHEYLRTNPEVKVYRYATAEEGGGGVTIAELR